MTGTSHVPRISGDGRYVTFTGDGRLAPGATGSEGLFVTDRRSPP